jgi:phage baseplate assembly protein W
MAQETKTILRHVVRQGDSLERLAQEFMGDAGAWLQLAILNGLTYPYLTDDEAYVTAVKATGTVTFTRTAATLGDVVIPSGSLVSAPATTRSPQKDYRTSAAATILNGTNTIDAPVTAVTAGEIGNSPSLTITLLGFTVTNLASVDNLNPVTGGTTLTVLKPGDTLLVPVDSDGLAGTAGLDTKALQGEDFFTALLGTDLALDADGDLFASPKKGLAVVAGIPNFQAAMGRRLATPLGWYPFVPHYGSNVGQAVGQRGDNYWLQRTRIEAERTLRGDPRVQDLQNIKVAFQSGTLAISFDVLMIGEKSPRNLVVQVRPTSGGQ